MKILNVLNMKRIVFPFLVMLMLGMSGCVKHSDNVQNYPYIPAFVDFSFEYGIILNTAIGSIVSSEIQNATDLWTGDAVLVTFTVNYDQQASTEYLIAYGVDYVKVGYTTAEGTTGGESTSGGFDFPIEDMNVFGLLDKTLFLIFGHKAPEDQNFYYEMTFDRDVTTGTQMLKIRARKNGEGTKAEKNIGYPYAFSINNFLYHSSENTVEFTIQYMTGVDEDGNEEFKTFVDESGNSVIKISRE